jgi:hypothetical protein
VTVVRLSAQTLQAPAVTLDAPSAQRGGFPVTTVVPLGSGQGEGLVAVKPIIAVEPVGMAISFTLPTDTFAHSQADAVVQLVATQIDGTALPVWLSFNAQTGTFVGQPPAGLSGQLVIRVIARDQDGREAVATIRINLAAGSRIGIPEQGQGDASPPAGDVPDGTVGDASPKRGSFETGFKGKPAFQDEVRMASRQSGARQAQLLAAARAVARNT